MHKHTLREGIAMVELIFALVIMGLVLMSAPRLLSTAAESSYVATQQEAISEAATQVNMIMGFHWDDADSNESYLDPILTVNAGHADLNVVPATLRRKGTPPESQRTFLRDDGTSNIPATAKAALGPEAGEPEKDDMDDFNGDSIHLALIDTGAGNVDTSIDINSTVQYITDTTAANYNTSDLNYNSTSTSAADTTNVKAIDVTLTSTSGQTELEKTITLHAFSCNVGGYELEKKDF